MEGTSSPRREPFDIPSTYTESFNYGAGALSLQGFWDRFEFGNFASLVVAALGELHPQGHTNNGNSLLLTDLPASLQNPWEIELDFTLIRTTNGNCYVDLLVGRQQGVGARYVLASVVKNNAALDAFDVGLTVNAVSHSVETQVSLGVRHTLRMTMSETTLRVYVDGSLKLGVAVSLVDQPISPQIGLESQVAIGNDSTLHQLRWAFQPDAGGQTVSGVETVGGTSLHVFWTGDFATFPTNPLAFEFDAGAGFNSAIAVVASGSDGVEIDFGVDVTAGGSFRFAQGFDGIFVSGAGQLYGLWQL